MLTVGSFVCFLAAAAVVQIATTWIAARVLRIHDSTFAKATGTYGLQVLVYFTGGLLAILTYFAPASLATAEAWLLALSVLALASIFVWVAIIRFMLRSNWWQAIAVYIAQSIAAFGIAVILRVVLIEGFVVPTNAMAPTIVGHRYLGPCAHCDGRVIVTAATDPTRNRYGPPAAGICAACWRYQDVEVDLSRRYRGDRIIASKIEHPRRWDVVVYIPPKARNQKYVHRLAGLPGEEIAIREGALWINGERLTPPPGLEKLRYVNNPTTEQDAGEEPAKWRLGDDEYFVLGDNTEASLDSRSFGPIRSEDLHSVAMAIYWPPDRVQLLRPELRSW